MPIKGAQLVDGDAADGEIIEIRLEDIRVVQGEAMSVREGLRLAFGDALKDETGKSRCRGEHLATTSFTMMSSKPVQSCRDVQVASI